MVLIVHEQRTPYTECALLTTICTTTECTSSQALVIALSFTAQSVVVLLLSVLPDLLKYQL